MITLTIDGALFSSLGAFYLALAGVSIIASAALLIFVLRGRIDQQKKGEEHAYRNY